MCWEEGQTIDDAEGQVDVRDTMVCCDLCGGESKKIRDTFFYVQNVPGYTCTILSHYGQNWLGEGQL